MSNSSHAGQELQATIKNKIRVHKQAPSGTTSSSHRIYSGTDRASTVFEDSGFFENEQTNTPRREYQDFILFESHQTTLYTGHLFEDVDVEVEANHPSIHEERNSNSTRIRQDISHADQRTPPPRAEFYDAVRDAAHQSVNEVVLATLAADFNQQPQQEYSRSPPATPYLRPVELWRHSYHRHESIAYRFEQKIDYTQQQRSRQQQS